MITAAGADEPGHVGAASAKTAVRSAGRLAPPERRAAGAGLAGKGERHDVARPEARPRVVAIMGARYADGDQVDSPSGTGHRVGVARPAHFHSPQAVVPAAAGVWSSDAVIRGR